MLLIVHNTQSPFFPSTVPPLFIPVFLPEKAFRRLPVTGEIVNIYARAAYHTHKSYLLLLTTSFTFGSRAVKFFRDQVLGGSMFVSSTVLPPFNRHYQSNVWLGGHTYGWQECCANGDATPVTGHACDQPHWIQTDHEIDDIQCYKEGGWFRGRNVCEVKKKHSFYVVQRVGLMT